MLANNKYRGHLTALVSASAVEANLRVLREQLGEGVKMCPAVKADCYGHGAAILLETLCKFADMFAVATGHEAIRLRELGCELPVLVFLSPAAWSCGDGIIAELIGRGVTLTLHAEHDVAMVSAAAKRVGAVASVHVMVDSGMGRSGVRAEIADRLIAQVRGDRHLALEGLYTHFASADKTFAHKQMDCFARVVKSVGSDGLTIHAANSAAMIDLSEAHLDMVRPGIACYGYQPSDHMHRRLPLRPALRLVGTLMLVKDIPAGGSCGYGSTYTFKRGGRIGLVPIGYADGYMYRLSNLATMRVDGCDAPVRGRVSMDQTIIDLTDVPQATAGMEVEIISNDASAPNSVETLAALAETIPYEITACLGRRINRELVE